MKELGYTTSIEIIFSYVRELLSPPQFKQHLYGIILHHLYKKVNKTVSVKEIRRTAAEYPTEEFKRQIEKLIEDGLITQEILVHTPDETVDGLFDWSNGFRITYKGYQFVAEIEHKNFSNRLSIAAIVITLFTAIVSIGTSFDANQAMIKSNEIQSKMLELTMPDTVVKHQIIYDTLFVHDTIRVQVQKKIGKKNRPVAG